MEKPVPAVDAASAFETWARARHLDASSPVFIVAAEGGGMRAATMTAMVLEELRAQYPGFLERLFAVVGVSGGSVGAASFAAAVRDPINIPKNWQGTFYADFLAPSVGSFLGGDLLARYVPRSLVDLSRWDRSRALEDAWSDGWKTATGADALRGLWFSDLFPKANVPQPYLVLMTTSVEDGEPMAVSHLCNFGIRTLAGIRPKLDVPLTTAAVMSARFPFVSSVALLPDSKPPVGFVDGGYYQNTGLTAVRRLIYAIQGRGNQVAVSGADCPNEVKKTTASVAPRVIVIRIENGATEVEQQSAHYMFEWLSPMSALYATSTSHDKEAVSNLHDLVDASKKAQCAKNSASPSIDVATFRLVATEKRPIPLGWVLSSITRKEIADQVKSESNAPAFAKIGAALGLNATPSFGQQCRPTNGPQGPE